VYPIIPVTQETGIKGSLWKITRLKEKKKSTRSVIEYLMTWECVKTTTLNKNGGRVYRGTLKTKK
jgi:hypothetical protein